MTTALTETLLNFLEKTISRLALQVFGNNVVPEEPGAFTALVQGRQLADWEGVYVNVSMSQTSDINAKDYLITMAPCNDRSVYYVFDEQFIKDRGNPNFTSFLACIDTFGFNETKKTFMATKGNKPVLAACLDIYPDDSTIMSTIPENMEYHIDVGYAVSFEVSFDEVLKDLLPKTVVSTEVMGEVSDSPYIADLSALNRPFTTDNEIEMLLSEMWKLTGQSANDIMKMILSGKINLVAGEEGAISPDYITHLESLVIFGAYGRIYYSVKGKKFYAVELINRSGKIIPLDLLKEVKTWNHKFSMHITPYEKLLETVKSLSSWNMAKNNIASVARAVAKPTVKDNITVEGLLVDLISRKSLSGAIQILDQINSRLRVESSKKVFFTYVDNSGSGPFKRNRFICSRIHSFTNHGSEKGTEVLISFEKPN